MDVKRIQRLQDISSTISSLNIDTPQIIAVGSQSSGKSSVLEQIVKRGILPRGTNLVTRCPIVLHLRRCRGGRESIVFDHLADPVYDFATVSSIISQRMEEICGPNKGISSTAITIFVSLRDMLEMTLVDLPGLIKVPIGEQPEDIELQIEDMVLDYAHKESTIILALVNANADIATNEALKIARKADPQLRRTLGVVTKIDLMDTGTDCMDILTNRCPRLALGYIGVVNRGQQEMMQGVSIEDSIHKESTYFRSSPVYGALYPNIGSSYLVRRLNEIFCRMVIETLPGIKTAIRGQLNDKMQRLREIEPAGRDCGRTLVLSYHQTVQSIFRHIKSNNTVFVRNVSNFLGDFKDLFKNKEPVLSFNDLVKHLRCSSYLFISEYVFEEVIRDNIREMLEFYLEKVDTAVRMLCSEISSISSVRFPMLARRLNSMACDCIESQGAKLVDGIRTYAAIQSSYINVDHPDFDKTKALGLILQRTLKTTDSGLLGLFNMPKEISLEDKRLESDLIRELAISYLTIVNREMNSYVINAIHYHLGEYIDTKLFDAVMGTNLEDSLLEESPDILQEREELMKDIEILKNTLLVLNEL